MNDRGHFAILLVHFLQYGLFVLNRGQHLWSEENTKLLTNFKKKQDLAQHTHFIHCRLYICSKHTCELVFCRSFVLHIFKVTVLLADLIVNTKINWYTYIYPSEGAHLNKVECIVLQTSFQVVLHFCSIEWLICQRSYWVI